MAQWGDVDNVKEGGGMFIKLKDGEHITGVFMGDPYYYYQIWGDSEKAEYSDYVSGSSFRFKVNFIVQENGVFVAKILNQGITLCKLIKKMMEEYGPNEQFKLERKGSTKDDTEYFLMPKGQVSAEGMAQIKEVELKDIEGKNKVTVTTGGNIAHNFTEAPKEDVKEDDDPLPF